MAEVLQHPSTLNEAQKAGILEQVLSIFNDNQFNTRCSVLLSYIDNSNSAAIVNNTLNMCDELYKANVVDSDMQTLIDE